MKISEIAAKANVSQVAIYNYFGDKNSLAKKALVFYLDRVIDEYEAILEEDVPFAEKLKIIMDKKYNAVTEIIRQESTLALMTLFHPLSPP